MPLLTVNSGVLKVPRSADGTSTPCTSTVTTMTSMPMRAIVLALANYLFEQCCISRTSLSSSTIKIKDRFVNLLPLQCPCITSMGS